MQFAFLDIITVVLLFSSLLWGAFRGFFREIMTVLIWGLALAAAFLFRTQITSLFESYLPSVPFKEILALLTGFIGFFILLSIVAIPLDRVILKLLSAANLRGFDRFLGLIFGFARAILLLGIFWTVFLVFAAAEDYFPGFSQGVTTDFVHKSAQMTFAVIESFVVFLGYAQIPEVQSILEMLHSAQDSYSSLRENSGI